jgi:hypothetical protein
MCAHTCALVGTYSHVTGETWSTHPKIIETTPQRGLRRAVPDRFPYFAVEWVRVRVVFVVL